MIEAIHKLFTLLVLGIGIVHTGATFNYFSGLTESAIWFAGAGLGGIFVALLNVAIWPRHPPPLTSRLGVVANTLFLAWLAAGVSATPELPQFVVGTVGAIMVFSAFWLIVVRR